MRRIIALAILRGLAGKNETGRTGAGHQPAFRIRDRATYQADRSTARYDFGLGSKLLLPDGTKEVDFQFKRREAFAGFQCAGESYSHSGIR